MTITIGWLIFYGCAILLIGFCLGFITMQLLSIRDLLKIKASMKRDIAI